MSATMRTDWVDDSLDRGRLRRLVWLSGVFALALGAAGIGAISIAAALTPPSPLHEAATRSAGMVAQYSRLTETDFNATIMPVTQGMAGRGACGVVVSGVEGGMVRWQRSQGRCAVSSLGAPGEPTMARQAHGAGPTVVVEVMGDTATGAAFHALAAAQGMPLLAGDRE